MAVFIAQDLADDRPELLASLSVNVIGLFFFTGLMFRQALLACAAMLLAFVLAAYAIGVPEPVLIRCMVMLGLTAVIGAIIGADVDGSYRRSVLEAAVIQQLAARDGLTGLMNRRAFDDHLNQVWQHAIRDQRNVAILMIDIDFFKRYNDTHGHQAGDEALRRVARVIDGFAKRPLDLAARYGGEEFAVILYDLTESDVGGIAERLRLAVQHERIGQALDEAERGAAGTMTVSVGAGIARPTIERTPASAIQLADEALYEAKEIGRNRIVVHGVAAYDMLHTGDFVLPSHARSGR
jgi:diguanylate cyclase (GGDEF)-like protein